MILDYCCLANRVSIYIHKYNKHNFAIKGRQLVPIECLETLNQVACQPERPAFKYIHPCEFVCEIMFSYEFEWGVLV